MPLPKPTNCGANDKLREVTFDVDLRDNVGLGIEAKIWKAVITYGRLDKLYARESAVHNSGGTSEARERAVSASSQVTRLVVERLRTGAVDEPIIIS